MPEDSIDGIFSAITQCARISKYGGGIGLCVSDVRGKGSHIKGTNGESDGLVPMLRVVNAVASYVNQGGRRKGSVAVYLEPHHPDILDVLALKRNSGDEHLRARDLCARGMGGGWGGGVHARRLVSQQTPCAQVLRGLGVGPLHAPRGGRRPVEPV